MPSTEVFEIVFWIIIIVVSIIIISLFVTASLQEGKTHIIQVIRKLKKRRRKNQIRKINERKIKAAPTHLKMLMQPEYIVHFESLILLLDKIDWPKYPESSIDEDGVEKLASRDELEDYEEELEEAIEDEDYLLNLYSEYLQSKNFKISQSELSYVVELYQKNSRN